MMTLDMLLDEYKRLSVEMLEKADEIDTIELLISKRANVINDINKIEYNKDEFKTLVHELSLMEIEDRLFKIISQEKLKTRKALDNVQKLKRAQAMYNREEAIPVYFNMQSY